MQINKQRLQLWLDEKVAAYNNGSSQDIEMIKELCKYSKSKSTPSGSAKFYAHDKLIWWYTLDTIDGRPHQPVSWFFEAEEAEKGLHIDQRIEALEKAVEEIRALLVFHKNNGLTN